MDNIYNYWLKYSKRNGVALCLCASRSWKIFVKWCSWRMVGCYSVSCPRNWVIEIESCYLFKGTRYLVVPWNAIFRQICHNEFEIENPRSTLWILAGNHICDCLDFSFVILFSLNYNNADLNWREHDSLETVSSVRANTKHLLHDTRLGSDDYIYFMFSHWHIHFLQVETVVQLNKLYVIPNKFLCGDLFVHNFRVKLNQYRFLLFIVMVIIWLLRWCRLKF